jgi:hypothetical protein
MSQQLLLTAVALMLVFEGILPFPRARRVARNFSPTHGNERRTDPLHRSHLDADRIGHPLFRQELSAAMRPWLLPEYVEDILPAEAARIERLRRSILDLFALQGYQLVMPPLLEYVESLLTRHRT